MTNRMARQIGPIISPTRIDFQGARGTSLDNFSEGRPNLFLLNPVILVLLNLQYPTQLFACPRVTSRHPPQELSIINNEIGV